jgi:hypothetical protein
MKPKESAMVCSHCGTTNRALYTHELPDGECLALCDLCLRDRDAMLRWEVEQMTAMLGKTHHCRLRPRCLDGHWRSARLLFPPARG